MPYNDGSLSLHGRDQLGRNAGNTRHTFRSKTSCLLSVTIINYVRNGSVGRFFSSKHNFASVEIPTARGREPDENLRIDYLLNSLRLGCWILLSSLLCWT